MINCMSIVVDYYNVFFVCFYHCIYWSLYVAMCTIVVYIYSEVIKMIDNLYKVVFVNWWSQQLDKYRLDRCEILFTIPKMRRSKRRAQKWIAQNRTKNLKETKKYIFLYISLKHMFVHVIYVYITLQIKVSSLLSSKCTPYVIENVQLTNIIYILNAFS